MIVLRTSYWFSLSDGLSMPVWTYGSCSSLPRHSWLYFLSITTVHCKDNQEASVAIGINQLLGHTFGHTARPWNAIDGRMRVCEDECVKMRKSWCTKGKGKVDLCMSAPLVGITGIRFQWADMEVPSESFHRSS